MMSSPNTIINGLPLPTALIQAIHAGRWIVPAHEKLRAAFPLEPIVHPLFYNLDCMLRENAGWQDETLKPYLGKKSSSAYPGDIDPTKSVLIADLGPERLIALDYRESQENPSVVYLTGHIEPQWIEAAPNIETLLSALDL
jgi:hypothetical protein